jgi:four helix bundle protein
MQIQRFEDFLIWKHTKSFVVRLYEVINSGVFKNDYNLSNQIQRAGISIMANIAEGFERQTKKEFIQFLYIAKGSSGEIRSLLYLAKDLNYLEEELLKLLGASSEESSIL